MAQLYFGCASARRKVQHHSKMIQFICDLFSIELFDVESFPTICVVDNLQQAKGLIHTTALQKLPTDEGWYNHKTEVRNAPARFVGNKHYEIHITEQD